MSIKKACHDMRELEPWPNYFELRSKELEIFLSVSHIVPQGTMLEIGCGNAFNACILAQSADKVVATDLFRQSAETHSQGMRVAQECVKFLGVKNCILLSCAGEKLPFKNETFDMIFSMYTLEHVSDRGQMLLEAKRILKKGGILILIVPSFMERLFYPFVFYAGLLVSFTAYLLGRKKIKDEGGSLGCNCSKRRNDSSFLIRFRKRYPHFPLPEPHGSYRNYFEEVRNSLPVSWKDICQKSGLEIVDSFSTMVVPKSLLDIFLGRMSFLVYKKLSWIDKKIGRNPFLKNFGCNICFILKRSA